MTINRREFIGYLAGTGGLALFESPVHGFTSGTVFAMGSKLSAFPFFLDTLLPEDETPSASSLGVHLEILELAPKITNYLRLLELGCQWLNMRSIELGFKDFSSLPQFNRDVVAARAEQGKANSIEKIFFDRIHADAFRFYYANQGSWPSLGLLSPPQPYGYPDYDRPPLQG